ncbi:MAG: AMP-binding protein [Candidatus Planktophila sp.]|nr:AMP-binding protein [Candidatus Planktophila sp.]MBP7902892.1 AMP-binding protein [Candidatus Planktophila sp.]
MARIAKALVSDGPALSLSPTTTAAVSSRSALLVSTTGSSGSSKEIELSAAALLSSARASNKFLGAEFGNTWSLLLPLNHIAGINVLIRSLELGTTPTNLLGYEGKFPKADYTAIVPTQLFRALNGDENLLNHLIAAKAVLVGGAALTRELRSKAEAAGITIVETYGSTETSGGCIYNGAPLDGVEVAIGDDNRIAIKGAILAHDLTNEDGWYFTSDAGHFDNGKVVIDGRIDDIVITGGENISLTAIDRVLAQCYPDIQSTAFAVADPEWGQAIHIALVGGDPSQEPAIQELLARELGAAAKGKGFHYVAELPLIGIGKVDKRALARLINE